MKTLNLRKASQINSEIQKKITELMTQVTPVINVKPNDAVKPNEVILEVLNRIHTSMKDIDDLDSIYIFIRDSVTVKNNESRITLMLNAIAAKERIVKRLIGLKNITQPAPEFSIIEEEFKQKLAERKAARQNSHYAYDYDPTVAIPLFTQEDIDKITSAILALKRDIRELQDKILVLNMSNTIEITDLDWSVLARLGVV